MIEEGESLDDISYDEQVELLRLKTNATKRKGRGFQESSSGRRESADQVNAIYDTYVDGSEGTGAQRSVEGWILFVRGVHEEATEEHIRDVFADYGQVKNLHLNIDRRTGYVKGYALIEFETYKEAISAIDKLNGSTLLGRRILVDFAFSKGPLSHQGTSGNGERRANAHSRLTFR